MSLVDIANNIENKNGDLAVYTDKRYFPKNTLFVYDVDDFFNSVDLRDDDITSLILKEIDCATYLNSSTILDRFGRSLSKNAISTSSKILLSILYFPMHIYSILELGNNAIGLLNLLSKGQVYVGSRDCTLRSYVSKEKTYTVNNVTASNLYEANQILKGFQCQEG